MKNTALITGASVGIGYELSKMGSRKVPSTYQFEIIVKNEK
jgi:short-subunit dehydrogenase involved in D-alanine esterification of teichoic acids